MALYIPHSIFHLGRLLYVRPETFGPYYVYTRILVEIAAIFFGVKYNISNISSILDSYLVGWTA